MRREAPEDVKRIVLDLVNQPSLLCDIFDVERQAEFEVAPGGHLADFFNMRDEQFSKRLVHLI
jgi:hypothetical protein